MRNFLSDAILSPCASNLQTYEFHWLRDTEKKKVMGGYCLGQPAGTEVVMVIAAGTGTPEGLFGNRVRFPFDDLAKEV